MGDPRTLDLSNNDVSLRNYVDTLFLEKEKALQAALLAQEKAVAAALTASDKAITKAEVNAEKWREAANEWRGAMSDRDRELPSRREVEQAINAIEAKIQPLTDLLSRTRGSGDFQARVLATIAAVASLGVLAFLVIHG